MSTTTRSRTDVVVGEVLVELSSTAPVREGCTLRLGFSGDALNVAAASSAAAARTVLLTRVPDDDLGDDLGDGRGDDLGTTASSLSVRGQGGTGSVPTLQQTRHALDGAPEPRPGMALR